jgi:hypothetical protein
LEDQNYLVKASEQVEFGAAGLVFLMQKTQSLYKMATLFLVAVLVLGVLTNQQDYLYTVGAVAQEITQACNPVVAVEHPHHLTATVLMAEQAV